MLRYSFRLTLGQVSAPCHPAMVAFRNFTVIALFVILPGVWRAEAQEYLRPPFGLFWGQNGDQIEKLLKGAKAKITERKTEGKEDRWIVQGIIQPALKQTNFYFSEKSLVGIELEYSNDSWDQARYNTFMDKFRAKIEGRFGPGTLISREKGSEQDVTQTMVGYEWKQDDTNLQLVYFAVEKDKMAYRNVSLHYRYVPMEIPEVPDGVTMEDLEPIGDPVDDKKAPLEDILPAKKEGESLDNIRPATGAGVASKNEPAPLPSPEVEAQPPPVTIASATPQPSPGTAITHAGSPEPTAESIVAPEASATPTPEKK